METETQPHYIAGTCNIGVQERAHRRAPLLYSLIICAVLIFALQWLQVSHVWRLFLFIPASIAAICFQQLYNRFCVAFGIRGVYNFGNVGTVIPVQQKEAIEKDKRKAQQMILLSLLFGALVSIAWYFCP